MLSSLCMYGLSGWAQSDPEEGTPVELNLFTEEVQHLHDSITVDSFSVKFYSHNINTSHGEFTEDVDYTGETHLMEVIASQRVLDFLTPYVEEFEREIIAGGHHFLKKGKYVLKPYPLKGVFIGADYYSDVICVSVEDAYELNAKDVYGDDGSYAKYTLANNYFLLFDHLSQQYIGAMYYLDIRIGNLRNEAKFYTGIPPSGNLVSSSGNQGSSYSSSPLKAAGTTNNTSVDPQKQSKLAVFPNPAQNFINVKVYADGVHPVAIQLLNETGKEQALSETLEITKAGVYTFKKDVSKLDHGVYIIRYTNGSTIESCKVILN